jgi:hypothetical protein
MLAIKDLFQAKELDTTAMSAISGGCHKYASEPMKEYKPGHGYGYGRGGVNQSGNTGGLNQVGTDQNGLVIGDGFSGSIGNISF